MAKYSMSSLDSEDTLIVGYPGRLARAFVWQWTAARRVGRSHFDITDRTATLRAMAELRPNLVVNCAALTDIGWCEREPDLAWAVNVRGVRHLAEGCQQVGATLVHFSSDYALNPVNEYAWTKRASESLAHVTIRAKIYDATHWAWEALRGGRTIRMLVTEYSNPISTTGVALITKYILLCGLQGLIAVGTLERLSFWQVGRIWAEVLGVDPNLVEAVDHLGAPEPRLREMYLCTDSLKAAGISVPTLAEDARAHLELYTRFGNISP